MLTEYVLPNDMFKSSKSFIGVTNGIPPPLPKLIYDFIAHYASDILRKEGHMLRAIRLSPLLWEYKQSFHFPPAL